MFGSPCSIDILLDDIEKRPQVEVTREKGKVEKLFIFVGDDPVKGRVKIAPYQSKRVEHKVQKQWSSTH